MIGRSPFPGWFSGQLREYETKKRILHPRFKATPRQEDYLAFREARNQIPTYSIVKSAKLATVHVTATEVEKNLKSLDGSKGPGLDMIPSRVLKLCAEVLTPHLPIHFNNLLFPHKLKVWIPCAST
ncbi:hypothetical protein J6590_093250 [Homalodisca vitripennis]|nr:hypothetical protein J6590_093250 [Homalodisca vitripennis]